MATGCVDGQNPFATKPADETAAPTPSSSTKLVERDVEAPEVFQLTDQGLWDGRPSLGGVWVATTDVKDPERVIIRNQANGKFVIGALFRRERDNPGPKLQVSSDAAAALGMLAGAPAALNVTALQRQEVADAAPAADQPAASMPAPGAIEEKPLDQVAATAAAAIDKAAPKGKTPPATPAAAPAAKPAPAPKPAPAKSKLAQPFIQIGIFSVEANANNTATALKHDGMIPLIKKSEASGKAYWRVIVGPATSASERAQLLKKVKALGFTDAYFTNG